jgi:hypothetical protein
VEWVVDDAGVCHIATARSLTLEQLTTHRGLKTMREMER